MSISQQNVNGGGIKPVTSIADFKRLPIWVCYGIKPQPGKKARKIPYTPGTNREAKVNDPSSWGSHASVVTDAQRTGRLPGFILTPHMNITLIDVDGRLDHELIATVDSYTERSINGGTHIIVGGRPPKGFTVPADVEVYPRTGNRGVLLTEDIIDGRNTIQDRTDLLAKLFPPAPPAAPLPLAPPTLADDDVLHLLRSSRNAPDFERAWNGDASKFDGDQSRNDESLASKIAFFTQDRQQILRIISQSSVWDAKWERPDYQERTIDRALNRSSFYTPGAIVMGPHRVENGAVISNPQDAGTGDDCASVRDELAALRAEKAALLQQLEATRKRAEKAESQLTNLRLLQSATMTMLRSKTMRPGEKVLGLVALFEAEAARHRGTTDPDGWSDAPLARLADAGGCSTDTAGRHLTTIASTGIVETRTVTRRDASTGEIRKHRQIRLAAVPAHEPAPELSERIMALSTARPARAPADQGWGGKRLCPDCGDLGTVSVTTVACAGCGQLLRQTHTTQRPESTDHTASPKPQLAVTTDRGSLGTPYPQVAASGREQRREWAAADLELREPMWLRDVPDLWDSSPQPSLFAVADVPSQSCHWAGD